MKIKSLLKSAAIISSTLLIGLSLTGCKVFGSNPTAPTPIEHNLFTVVTNYVNVPVVQTNIVLQTNTVGQIVSYTNVVNQIVPVPSYTLTPSDTTKQTVQAGGSIVNSFYPGMGGIVVSGILGLLAVWGRMRSTKLGNTASAVSQEVESIREFIKQLPNGAAYDTAITAYLQQHQTEAGVATQVLQILANDVSNTEAKGAAQELLESLKAAQATSVPVKPA